MSDLAPEETASALADLGIPGYERTPEPVADEPEEPQADTPQEEEPQAEAPEPEAQPVDPLVQQYLDRFGGDVDKAIRSAAHQQDLVGRQGSELGDLRKQVEELSQRFPADQQPQQPEPPAYNEEQFDEYVLENPEQAATWALQTYGHGSRPYDRALASWAEDNPVAANRFDTGYLLWQQQQQLAQTYEQRLQPLQEQQQVQQLAQSYHKVRQRYPDASQYETRMQEIAAANPQLVQSFASNPEALIEFLYSRARLDTGDAPSPQSPSRDAVAEKMAATVATASTAPAADKSQDRDPIFLTAQRLIEEDQRLIN